MRYIVVVSYAFVSTFTYTLFYYGFYIDRRPPVPFETPYVTNEAR